MAIYKSDEKTKDGRCWYYTCYKDNKKYKSKKFLTKQEAKEQEALFLLKRDNPTHKSFDIVAEHYFNSIKKTIRQSTYISYKNIFDKHIKGFFKDINITNLEYSNWVEKMNKTKLSTIYKNKIRMVIINILNFAILNYGIEKNIASIYGSFKEPKDKVYEDKIRYITLEDFNKFISFVDEPLWKCWFITGFYTGCRKSELFCLKFSDIDDTFISINKTISRGFNGDLITSTKNNLNRKIKLNNKLKEELISYKKYLKEKYSDFNENWYVFGNTKPLARTTADRYKTYYFKKANMKELTYHELFRHSAVSLLMNELLKKDSKLDINKALFTLSNRFGHTPEVMIKTYAHLYQDNIQDEIVDILDNL